MPPNLEVSKYWPHSLGRTWTIYGTTQTLTLISVALLIARAVVLSQRGAAPPAELLAMSTWAIAWVFALVLNHFETKYTFRSSDYIYIYYLLTIIACAIQTRSRVLLDQNTSDLQFQLLMAFFGTNMAAFIIEALPRGRTKVQRQSGGSQFEKANWFSRVSFHYMQQAVSLGYKRPLEAEDVANMMPKRLTTKYSHEYLSKRWEAHVAKCQAKGTKPSLLRLILTSYGSHWLPILIYRFAASGLQYASPKLLNSLLDFIQSYREDDLAPKPLSLGILLALGLFLCSLVVSFIQAAFFVVTCNFGIEVRTALIAMLYRKSLVLSSAAKQKSTIGEITNHMSVDAERWSLNSMFLPMLISAPFEIGLAIWMLYQQIGWSVFLGLATIIGMIPIQGVLAKFYQRAKTQKLEAMDVRLRLVNEVLSGIKIVKLYGWEDSFRDKIQASRNREIRVLRKLGVTFSIMSIMFSTLPMLVSLVSFAVYATVGGPGFTPGNMSPQVVFVSISLFGLLTRPISMLSHALAETVGLKVATNRINKFLLAEEIHEGDVEHTDADPENPTRPVVEIENGVFAWVKEQPDVETEKEKRRRIKTEERQYKQAEKEAIRAGKPAPVREPSEEEKEKAVDRSPTLKNIHFTVQSQSLTAIVGRVGQGKTSLLSSIIGDMYKRLGTVRVSGRIAYAAQQAWIVNATVRDNIVFGMPFDQDKYDRIIYAAGLKPDIEMLPGGDQTEIGERGINLSGGQKQRISLARAAYQDADVYLLDDPLSAVDAHVDQHLWENLIGPEGLLKDKTRLLVTHGIHHLEYVDNIVVMKNGEISENGRYDDLMATKSDFHQLIKEYSVNEGRKKDKDERSSTSVDDDMTEDGNQPDRAKDGHTHAEKPSEDDDDDKANLVEKEKMESGSVSWKVYNIYLKAVTYRNTIITIALFFGGQACQIGTNLWLKRWTDKDDEMTLGLYLGIYAVLIAIYMLASLLVTYVIMVVACLRASRLLHDSLLHRVLTLPMSFFDTTPLGRVVNRFSSDIFSLDELVPWAFMSFLMCFAPVVGTLIVIAVTTPLFLATIPPLFIMYVFIQDYYIKCSRALKRIDSVSKSPIYQHFSETLSGVSSVRAMRVKERFTQISDERTNVSSNAFYAWIISNRWLQIRLEVLGSLIVFGAALFAVLGRDHLDPSMVGLSLSYALSVTQEITWLVRSYCDLQNQLVSIERIDEYQNLNSEAPHVLETDKDLPNNWPPQGRLEFRNYSTRYREGLDLVVKNISVNIQPGQKVGIVGRTGAGKSSLTLALFRIIEAANSHWAKASYNSPVSDAATAEGEVKDKKEKEKESEKEKPSLDLESVGVEEDGGSIWIDGIDISTVGLKYLRQHLAIIPQDPTLFAGTLRENLDPFNELQDADLWEALERAHLKEYISSLQGGLHFKVSQNGDNFSVGQRSLLCLARALLRKTKILVLDEATSSVDMQTDELIQRTIRTEFKDRTILTIAHRIKTIMDSDKILVLEQGRVQEFDSPQELLARDSLFYRLALQAGEVKEELKL
ncbi:Multidrug resistance-associated protein 1 [Actinomortierella ambigua]|uniref:Multidrug resistance-associated protein 1 n=1 Tax=Actinomortierella ambigua TaxID=1343610 RepID=A0A9P6U2V0_9FUNG|nr:Multidrug resistance-associated protein 1 [Actinomortierella ambigua]